MRSSCLTTLLLSMCVLAACVKEPPPPSVEDYVSNKILRDAALAKCSNERAKLKYTPECTNAREASNKIAKFEEDQRSQALEAQSERKRAALRRAQMAAAEARRRAEEAARLRKEAEYLAQFGAGEATAEPVEAIEGEQPPGGAEPADAVAPIMEGPAVSGAPAGGDLQSIREELERRQRQPE